MRTELKALIDTPAGSSLNELCERLSRLSPREQRVESWPRQQLRQCGEFGVYRWFLPRECGGVAWRDEQILAGYVALSAACLTTTFVITQRTAACRRILASQNAAVRDQLLPGLADGSRFATVGISHLTTSHRHLARPILTVNRIGDQVQLDGFSPWVTGAIHADTIVLGALTPDQQPVLVAVPGDQRGLSFGTPHALMALTASCTGRVNCDAVRVDRAAIVAESDGPANAAPTDNATGGLSTSALAVGLSLAAVEYLMTEAARRANLARTAQALADEWQRCYTLLVQAAGSQTPGIAGRVRTAANSLVLRATQAALGAAKGAGFVEKHPVGRWCREATFFLVWSCPQDVIEANLCEFADLPVDHESSTH